MTAMSSLREFDADAEHIEESCQPDGMGRPGRGGHEVPVHLGLVEIDLHICGSGIDDIRGNGRVAGADFALQHARRREELRSVTNRGDWFACLGKMADDFDDALVQTEVFRGTAAGDAEGVVLFRPDFIEIRVEREIMAPEFAIGLGTVEVVHGSADLLPRRLTGTDGVHRQPHHLERLKRHHDLIIFHIVTNQHQDFHGNNLRNSILL